MGAGEEGIIRNSSSSTIAAQRISSGAKAKRSMARRSWSWASRGASGNIGGPSPGVSNQEEREDTEAQRRVGNYPKLSSLSVGVVEVNSLVSPCSDQPVSPGM